MGFNTVAVLYNDCVHDIREYGGNLGQRLGTAMTAGWSLRDRNTHGTSFGAGQVVSQAHADYSQVVVVGHNTGRPITECADLDHYALGQIADALRRHGWTVKPPKKAKRVRQEQGEA